MLVLLWVLFLRIKLLVSTRLGSYTMLYLNRDHVNVALVGSMDYIIGEVIMMKKLIRHFRRWNVWRKYNVNGTLHHILVLFGLVYSSTMEDTLLPEERLSIKALRNY